MPARKPDPLDTVSRNISDLYVALEDFREEVLDKTRLRILALFQELRVAMDAAEQHLTVAGGIPVSYEVLDLPSYKGPLVVGEVYTRNDLRELFGITDATLNNGIFRPKGRAEVWLFVTENKSADREQYVDKLNRDVLYWQGQRRGRTDPLIIDHKRNGELLLLFYRTAKYQFEGSGFVFEGPFEYVSHSGGLPTSFVLQRHLSH